VIEDLIVRLRDDVAVVIVTHNLQQAYRVADHIAFIYLGDLGRGGDQRQIAPGVQREQEKSRHLTSGAGSFWWCPRAEGKRPLSLGAGKCVAEEKASAVEECLVSCVAGVAIGETAGPVLPGPGRVLVPNQSGQPAA
jgi:ABC-type multidrug transport system ATPase subunit